MKGCILKKIKRDFSLLSTNKCAGRVGVVADIVVVVAAVIARWNGGQAPFVNSILSMAMSLLHTPITASICI